MDLLEVTGLIDVYVAGSDEKFAGKLSSDRFGDIDVKLVGSNKAQHQALHRKIAAGEIKSITFNTNHRLPMDVNQAMILAAIMDLTNSAEIRLSQDALLSAEGMIEAWYDADKREYVIRRVNADG